MASVYCSFGFDLIPEGDAVVRTNEYVESPI